MGESSRESKQLEGSLQNCRLARKNAGDVSLGIRGTELRGRHFSVDSCSKEREKREFNKSRRILDRLIDEAKRRARKLALHAGSGGRKRIYDNCLLKMHTAIVSERRI